MYVSVRDEDRPEHQAKVWFLAFQIPSMPPLVCMTSPGSVNLWQFQPLLGSDKPHHFWAKFRHQWSCLNLGRLFWWFSSGSWFRGCQAHKLKFVPIPSEHVLIYFQDNSGTTHYFLIYIICVAKFSRRSHTKVSTKYNSHQPTGLKSSLTYSYIIIKEVKEAKTPQLMFRLLFLTYQDDFSTGVLARRTEEFQQQITEKQATRFSSS